MPLTKEQKAAYKRAWYLKNKERILQKQKEKYYSDQEFRECHNAKSREYYTKHKDILQPRYKEYSHKRYTTKKYLYKKYQQEHLHIFRVNNQKYYRKKNNIET